MPGQGLRTVIVNLWIETNFGADYAYVRQYVAGAIPGRWR
jgi:hypothetical protein